jgi:hypothetical protein
MMNFSFFEFEPGTWRYIFSLTVAAATGFCCWLSLDTGDSATEGEIINALVLLGTITL